MTLDEYTKQYKQEATRLENRIAAITTSEWSECAVLAVLADASNDAVLRIAVEHAKFAGIFTAGKQLADWCFKELDRRRLAPDYQLTISEQMFGKM
jgi:hypothetical protein